MRRARADQGTIERFGIGRSVRTATITCCHCNTVVEIPDGARADDCGGFCFRCMLPTCRACASLGCVPFERQLERMESRSRLVAACAVDAAQTRGG